jgi:hypothetical protein
MSLHVAEAATGTSREGVVAGHATVAGVQATSMGSSAHQDMIVAGRVTMLPATHVFPRNYFSTYISRASLFYLNQDILIDK